MSERDGAGDAVVAMFGRIAPVYDRMNTLMTAGLDAAWRRAAVRAARLRGGSRVLDVACGTGKLTRDLAAAVGADGEVVGIDLAEPMLSLARRHGSRGGTVRYAAADAMALPFPDGSFDAATIAFGLRNLPDLRGGLAEMVRVLSDGGRAVVLEIAAPPSGLPLLLHRVWFRRIIPVLGSAVGLGAAYRYLPASLERYPGPAAIAKLMAEAGLVEVRWRRLVSGMATVHVGTRRMEVAAGPPEPEQGEDDG